MGNRRINILCYADDATVIAENEDDAQRLLFNFAKAAEQYNMKISIEKTKSMVIAKNPIRCKLVINNKSVEQVMKFNYLGVETTAYRDIKAEMSKQTNKASLISGCLRQVVWRNKYMSQEAKVKIYKTCVRPISTYALECRADTSITKQKLRATEMKTLRKICDKTLRDQIKSAEIRKSCKIPDIVRWVRGRRRDWRDHVERMDNNRLAKIAYTEKPYSQRLPGRPPKRWKQCWSSISQEQP
ncbi:uncharacterized protein LOC129610383 [Condylostylus longicornis]|uniref:uncharacterized protein LOC129610383 n=1 Tax=Condylostylus longicornis TaxID=2530218 RepID=UPI00244E57E7|nr:uncharacterized protein LOC129610383 [Condylostylus longicornis]